MSLRLIKIVKEDANFPVELKEVPFAYINGVLSGLENLSDQPVEIRIVNGKIECEAIHLSGADYSRRKLNDIVHQMVSSAGTQAFDALSSTRDLLDFSCFLWDDLRPYPVNPKVAPVMLNGAPLSGQVTTDTGTP